ncbi:hypothetical protein PR202_ga06630 [Eleusine coracana subsp. coracana]|uniref:SBP-type domain-containing protein n=1 Tax=Eleusine coracana subsp. coracana TaxID=191504 RepID=A0AAV5BVD2_ELECO|nr:hypothetical protein PR202_ga06630 [Eleusine coracana subsp. coracana]
MMSNRLMMNSNNAMSPTTDVDFTFPPMQPNQLGFDATGMSSMPSVVERPPLHHQQQHNNLVYDNNSNNFDFAAAGLGFSFQDSSPSLLPPTTTSQLPLAPTMAMLGMPQPPLQMPPPLMTTLLPGVPTAAELYHPFGGGGPSPSSFLKREDYVGPVVGGGGRIGLNLGRRTYFSPADVLAVDRLLMTRSRLGGVGGVGLGMAGMLGLGLGAAAHHQQQPPRCQAEGCKADLSAAKHYHRRHKVCEYHAKAAAVAAAGKQQRFCQQCSRYICFMCLPTSMTPKRSCRKRLTEHNRRRRKPASAQGNDSSPPPPKKQADTSSITTSYNSDHNKSLLAPTRLKRRGRRANDGDDAGEEEGRVASARGEEEVEARYRVEEGSAVSALGEEEGEAQCEEEEGSSTLRGGGASTTAAAKSTAISPNGSGITCLLDMDNGQKSSAAPTALSLAALPLPEKDGGLATMLMQQVRSREDDDEGSSTT